MQDTHLMSPSARMALRSAARDLRAGFRGVFGAETIESLLLNSYNELAATAAVRRWLVLSAERFTRQRLEALAHAECQSDGRIPAVLFLCAHNAGRSQMARGWFSYLAGNGAIAWSAGWAPVSVVEPSAAAAMAEVGIDISAEFPKPWIDEFVLAADVVVTMGCGDACPLLPGKHYEDWEIDDPAGKTAEEIRLIRDEIRDRVTLLVHNLEIA